MGRKLFANNANTTLAGSITNSATSCSATSGGGALFPAIAGGSGNTYQATLIKNGVPTTFEIITVTARVTDTFTILRAQEGTTALSWNAGDTIALLPTAADLTSFAQAADLQSQAGNYALDTGSANNYVAIVSPALTAHEVGMPIVWKAANSNTGASVFNDGVGTGNLLTPANAALSAGMVIAGGIYVAVWDGSNFYLENPWVLAIAEAFASGAASTAQSNAESYAAGQAANALSAAESYTNTQLAQYALLNSPTFIGNPQAPTQAFDTNNNTLATMAALFAAMCSGLLSGNGYVKIPLSNGGTLIVQWGSGPANGPVSFPIAFPSAVFTLNMTTIGSESFLITSLTTTSFNYTTQAGEGIYWIAIGH